MYELRQITSMAKILLSYKFHREYCNYYPRRLWIEPTNSCNLKCEMCLNKELPREQCGFMDIKLYQKLIKEIAGKVYDIYLHHRGESLLHKDFSHMVRYASDHDIFTRLHTNATVLTPQISEDIIDSGLDFISFSFDGYMREEYESVRIGAEYKKTLKNIVDFLKIKKQKKITKPYTTFTVIEFKPHKKKERNILLKQFKGLPLDAIRIRKAHNWAGSYGNYRNREIKSFIPCTFLWYSLTILWNGDVVPCPQDFFSRLKIGNVGNTRLWSLWNSDRVQELRKKMKINTYQKIDPCNKCDRICRSHIAGIPIDGLIFFLKDNLLGY